jgi:hypothetical protein
VGKVDTGGKNTGDEREREISNLQREERDESGRSKRVTNTLQRGDLAAEAKAGCRLTCYKTTKIKWSTKLECVRLEKKMNECIEKCFRVRVSLVRAEFLSLYRGEGGISSVLYFHTPHSLPLDAEAPDGRLCGGT